MSPLTIHQSYKALPYPEKELLEMAKAIYQKEKADKRRQVSLVVCSDYTIKKLNAAYRGKNRATDVLSFSFEDDDLLGEIYISSQRAAVQARKFGFTYEGEILRLFIHGMFHLLGYDHEKEDQRLQMEAKEALYWKTII